MSAIDNYKLGDISYIGLQPDGSYQYAVTVVDPHLLYELSKCKLGRAFRDCTVIQNTYFSQGDRMDSVSSLGSLKHALAFVYQNVVFYIETTVKPDKSPWQQEVEDFDGGHYAIASANLSNQHVSVVQMKTAAIPN